MGNQPTHYVVFQNKANKEKIFVGDAWTGQFGLSIGLRKPFKDKPGVETLTIKYTDGTETVITPESHFINVNQKKGADAGGNVGYENTIDNDMPF